MQKNGGELAKKYSGQGYQSLARTGDIYCLFYEVGLRLLKKETGILSYITSNKWLRAAYGEKMRRHFAQNVSVIQLIDLGPGVFNSATVDTNILTIKKSVYNAKPKNACKLESYSEQTSLSNYVKENSVSFEPLKSGDSWVILSAIEKSILDKIKKIGTPLKDWDDINIYYGIKTGYNKAFIVDNETKERLCKEDPKSAEILKPVLRGRDIKRYKAEWAGLWLICTHNGYSQTPPVDVNKYPAVKNHLNKHWKKVSTRQDFGKTPYNLRNCAYYEEFLCDKIIYQEIVHKLPNFFYDDNKKYYVEASAFLMTGNNLGYILLFLNSQLGYYFFKAFYSGGGLGDQGVRYKKHYLEQMHIPKIKSLTLTTATSLLDKVLSIQDKATLKSKEDVDRSVNRFFYRLFNFTEKEIYYLNQHLAYMVRTPS